MKIKFYIIKNILLYVHRFLIWIFLFILSIFIFDIRIDFGVMPRSLGQLIADPVKYDGDRIITGGFFLYNPAGVGHLYMTKDDAEYGIDYNSILIVLEDINKAYLPVEDFQARFVMVQGKFVSAYLNGRIVDVERILAFEKRGLNDCRYQPLMKGETLDKCGPRIIDRGERDTE